MDFMNRGERPVQQNAPSPATGGAPHNKNTGKKLKDNAKLVRIAQVGFLALIVILVVAVVASMFFTKKEQDYVDKGKFQAVFLNGGQVYFGKVGALNSDYLSMSNIYYLRVNQQVQPDQQQNASNDISLVKLGCELHGPQDEMVINREQVIFWENLKDDGQVAKAVAEYVKTNPDGQKCEQAQSNNNNSGAANTTTNTGNSTTPATNTGTGNTGTAPAANTNNTTPSTTNRR